MMTLLQNCVWVFSMTLALGVAGGVATRPFSWSLPFAPLIQPLIGLLLISTGTLALYVVLHLPLRIAGGVAWGVCCFASMMTRNQEPRRRRSLGDWCAVVGVSLFAGLLAAAVTTATSIRYGEPAFVYLDGTDHLGYAHMADWLNEHLVTELPVLDRTQPYTSWPYLLVTQDPRFGTFTTLALVSQVVGRSGMFSYDIACALVLTITVLAMAGVFARTRVSLALLVLGLVTCHWFDYGRTGFFAKAIAFPSIFVVAGLFMVAARQRLTLYPVTVLVLLTSGAALMQSGTAAALFLVVIGGPYVCLRAAYGMSARELGDLLRVRHDSPLSSSKQCARAIVREGAIGLGLLSCTAVISSGTLARPLSPSFPDWGHSWEVIFPRVLELETQNLAASVMRPWQLNSALFISVCLVLAIAVLAVFRRDARATAMIVGPAVLLMMLRVADQRAVAFQMIGSFYPLFLCAAASLATRDMTADAVPTKIRTFTSPLVFSVMIVAILLHGPRFINAVLRFSVAAPEVRQVSAGEMRQLALEVGAEPVEVAIGYDINLALVLLVELGRQNIALQWSQDSWRAILGYRPTWRAPQYSAPATLRIIKRGMPTLPGQDQVLMTRQFELIRLSPPRDG